MADEEVWIQLYVGEEKSGQVILIVIASLYKNRIHYLKNAVHQANSQSLGHCDAAKLVVYKAGTEFPLKEEDKLTPGQPVPEGTSEENPLRVVAPAVKEEEDHHVPNLPTPASDGKSPAILYQPSKAPSTVEGKLQGMNHVSNDSGKMQCSSTPACVALLKIFEAVSASERTIEKKFRHAAEYFTVARNRLLKGDLPRGIVSNERFLTGAMATALNAVLDDGFAVLHQACLGGDSTHSDLWACRVTRGWPRTLLVGEGKMNAGNLRNATRGQMLNELLRHRKIDDNEVYSPILLFAFDNVMLEIDLAFPSKKGGKLETDGVVSFESVKDKEEVFWTVQLIRTSIVDDCSERMAIILCFLSKALKELDSWPQTSRLQYKTPMPLTGKEDIVSAEYYGDNVTKITTKEDTNPRCQRVYKEFCYHLRDKTPNPFFVPDSYAIKKKDQRHPPPKDLLGALGQPYSAWKVETGPFGISVLCYDFIKASNPSVKGWIMILHQVKSMHEADYIHGDLLPRNVLFHGDEGYVIDFDLSRKVGAKYVEGYNHTEFKPFRHEGARPGQQMQKVHDFHALREMSKAFFDVETFAELPTVPSDEGVQEASDESDEEVQEAILKTIRASDEKVQQAISNIIQVFEENQRKISPNSSVWPNDATSSVKRKKYG